MTGLRPRILVELGVHAGDSYCAFCQAIAALNLPTQCTGIDTWQGDPQTGSYGPEILRSLRAHHDPLYSHFSRLLPSTFDAAAPAFPDGSIDLLHIDGLHTYAAAKHDLEIWLPKLSPVGILLLHDTQVHTRDFGVHQLWREISARFPSFEFHHSNGLGLLAMLEALSASSALAEFFTWTREDPQTVRNTFSALGKKLTALRADHHPATSPETFCCAIESPGPPNPLPAGSAIVLEGFAFRQDADLESLTLLLSRGDAPRQKIPITEGRLPRRDILASFAASDWSSDQRRRALRSGFWTVLPIPGDTASKEFSLRLCATFTDGRSCFSSTQKFPIAPSPPNAHAAKSPTARLPAHPHIAICLATFNPELSAFRRQIDSIRAQTYPHWTCIIQDDNSSPPNLDLIRQTLADDPRFTLHTTHQTRGFYQNFQQALQRVPADADLVCLADQDDRCHPDKLATLRANFSTPDTTLVYSDMRIVDHAGDLLSDTFWTRRKNNCTDLESLFFANTITGAASMFKAALLPHILPFPEQIGTAYHDWWIALCALAAGRIQYIPRPLQDYYQHHSNAAGWNPHTARPIHLTQLWSGNHRRELLFAARSLYAFRCKFLAQCAVILRNRFPLSTKRTALDRLAHLAQEPISTLTGQALRSFFSRRASHPQERNILLAYLLARIPKKAICPEGARPS